MSITDDLYAIETKLKEHSDKIKDKNFNEPLDNLENAAKKIGKSWSGSWLGYQSLVYYEGLAEPPSGARFSQECGLTDMYISDTKGKWVEYKFEDIINVINDIAGNPKVSEQGKQSAKTQEYFEEAKSSILSFFSIVLESKPNDKYIEELKEKAEKQKILYARDFINALRPSKAISADSIAIEQGFKTPPHLSVLANINAMRQPFIACGELSKIANRLASHLKKQSSDRNNVKNKLEAPSKVTIPWLYDNVPVKLWCGAISILITAFLLGITIAQIPFVQRNFPNLFGQRLQSQIQTDPNMSLSVVIDKRIADLTSNHEKRLRELQEFYSTQEKQATDMGHIDEYKRDYKESAIRISEEIKQEQESFTKNLQALRNLMSTVSNHDPDEQKK